MSGLIFTVIILLLSFVLLLCSYYSIIDELPKSFIMKFLYRIFDSNKILSYLINNVHPITYYLIMGISLFNLILFILQIIFNI